MEPTSPNYGPDDPPNDYAHEPVDAQFVNGTPVNAKNFAKLADDLEKERLSLQQWKDMHADRKELADIYLVRLEEVEKALHDQIAISSRERQLNETLQDSVITYKRKYDEISSQGPHLFDRLMTLRAAHSRTQRSLLEMTQSRNAWIRYHSEELRKKEEAISLLYKAAHKIRKLRDYCVRLQDAHDHLQAHSSYVASSERKQIGVDGEDNPVYEFDPQDDLPTRTQIEDTACDTFMNKFLYEIAGNFENP